MIRRFLVACLALLALPGPAHAFDYEIKLGLLNRFTLRRNTILSQLLLDPSTNGGRDPSQLATALYLNPNQNDTYYALVARTSALFGITSWLTAGLTLDSGELRPYGRLFRVQQGGFEDPTLAQVRSAILTTQIDHPATSNGRRIKDEAEDTFFLREAFLKFATPGKEWFVLELGRKALSVADGLIYDDYGLGARAIFDLRRQGAAPLSIELQGIIPTRSWRRGFTSPLLEARVSYQFSDLESIGLSAVYFHDGGNDFAQLFTPLIAETPVLLGGRIGNREVELRNIVLNALGDPGASSGDIVWINLGGSKIFDWFLIEAQGVVQLGSLKVDYALPEGLQSALGQDPVDQIDVSTLAFAASAAMRALITDTMVIGGWFLYLSGSPNPYQDGGGDLTNYRSFLSLVPYLTYTNIFFSGGVNETFTGRNSSTAGVNGRGVMAFGLTYDWEPEDVGFELDVRGSGLFSAEPSFDVLDQKGGRFYGVELDLRASYDVFSWLSTSVEYDVLFTGNFFRDRRPIHQFIVAIDLTYDFDYDSSEKKKTDKADEKKDQPSESDSTDDDADDDGLLKDSD